MTRLNGIDISNWQGDIDLSKLAIDFAFVKATEGTGYVNPRCDTKVQQLRKLGKLWGFYHFASGTDPIAEADYFVKHTLNYFGEGIPVLDFEADAISKGASWARQFLQRIYERTKVRPMIYMSQSVCTMHDWTAVARENALWVAQYPNVSHPNFSYNGNPPAKLGAFPYASAWQFCSDGRISGYGGNLDLDWFYGDAKAWKAIARGDLSTSNAPNVDKPTQSTSVLENDEYKVTVTRK